MLLKKKYLRKKRPFSRSKKKPQKKYNPIGFNAMSCPN
jgi:hypothetical protein